MVGWNRCRSIKKKLHGRVMEGVYNRNCFNPFLSCLLGLCTFGRLRGGVAKRGKGREEEMCKRY